jgi:hypothetical protein
MNTAHLIRRSAFSLGLVLVCVVLALPTALADDATQPLPSIIKDGFKLWASKDASFAIDAWKKGGFLQNDAKTFQLTRYFSQMDRLLGNFKSYDVIQSKTISQSSSIFYVAINFNQAIVYARFLVYRADAGWVVQNMDFSPKPEALMPWLSFAGGDYGQ